MAQPQDPFKGAGKSQEEFSRKFTESIDFLRDSINSLGEQIRDLLDEAISGTEGLDKATQRVARSYQREIASGVKKLAGSLDNQISLQTKFNQGVLKTKDIENERLRVQSTYEAVQSRIRSIQTLGIELSQEELTLLNAEYEQQLRNLDVLEDQNREMIQQRGLTDSLISGLEGLAQKLGGAQFAEALDIGGALESAREGEDSFEKIRTFTGAITKNLKASIQPIDLISFAGYQLLNALKSTDSEVGNLAKSFNRTYTDSVGLRNELNTISNLSADIAVNTKGLQESLVAVGSSLGSNAQLNSQDLVTFTKLREQAGYTNDELVGIQKLSLITGKSLEDNTSELLGSAQAVASQNKLLINEKQILKDVSSTSSAVKLSLGGSTDALANAVVQARALGTNLDKVEQIAGSLLDFEQSISSELEAELLTGKNLNLERARLAALNNDYATVAAEIAKQVGSSAQFTKMNRIQQEALAKSVGMTREELANSLMEREAIAALSDVEGKTAKERFDNLVKSVGMEEAKKQIGNEQLANQYAQQSIQERFNLAMVKLQEIFVALAGPVLQIVEPLASLATNILPLINVLLTPILSLVKAIGQGFSDIGKIFKGDLEPGLDGFLQVSRAIAATWIGILGASKLIGKENIKNIATQVKLGNLMKADFWKSIGSAIAKMWGAITGFLGPFGIPVAIAGAAALVGLASKFFTKGDDIVSPGYGKRTLLSPEGAITLNDKDTVIAGTNLGGGKDQQTLSSSSTSINLTPLVERMSAVENLLTQILTKEGSVYLDGTKVGTAMAMSTYKTQ